MISGDFTVNCLAKCSDTDCTINLYSELDGCIVWNAHNTVFGSKRSATCAQALLSAFYEAQWARDSQVDGDCCD